MGDRCKRSHLNKNISISKEIMLEFILWSFINDNWPMGWVCIWQRVNTLGSCICQPTGLLLLQVMACCHSGPKPLTEAILFNLFINYTLINIFQQNLKQNTYILFPEIAFKNAVCQMLAILFQWPQWVKLALPAWRHAAVWFVVATGKR